MKLRAVTLENVRRFHDPVRIGPIGNGLTLLCEPNESGKSTLFDALHALFFVSQTSWAAEVKALQPHSGGKVAVGAEIEIDGEDWRIWKQWQPGAGGQAKVWKGPVLVHQGDEARDWIHRLIEGEGGGPAGLLWVRQGRVTLSADGKYSAQDTRGEEHEQRRGLLTAVSGAMDEVTGGQRMDAALDRVRDALSVLETATGRPKTGGPWAAAEMAVATWTEKTEELKALVDDLRGALDERRALRSEAERLDDPEAAARQKADLAAAEAALEEAERHAAKMDTARVNARLARQEHGSALAAAARAQAVRRELTEAELAHGAAARRAGDLRDAAAATDQALAAATKARAEADEHERAARGILRAVDARRAAELAEDQRKDLGDRLERAEAAERMAEAREAAAARGPDDKTVQRIEALARDLDRAEAQREAGAPRVSVRYTQDALRVTLDGRALAPDEAVPVPEGSALILPGIGEMTVTQGGAGRADPVATAQARLRDALDDGGWDDLAALKGAAQARAADLSAATEARATLAALAPRGLAALRQALAALPAPPEGDGTALPDPVVAAKSLEAAERARTDAMTGEEAARSLAGDRRAAAAGAASEAKGEAERLKRALEAVDALEPETDAARDARLALLEAAAVSAEAAAARLEEAAPDVLGLSAHLKRLRGVKNQTEHHAQTLRTRLAALGARIDTRAGEGVEEALEDARNRLAAAKDRLGRVAFEAAVLRRLRAALEEAQTAARERYFGPVAAELRPLLEDLWEDADLVWSDDTLLPEKLVRRGTTEPIGVLSGGTQEQIAFLVRLAFARLLAKAGRHAPLILDDALVYSDDDRIERMFEALHRASGDLQIIVLSCRQRAFSGLGAPQVRIEPAGEAP